MQVTRKLDMIRRSKDKHRVMLSIFGKYRELPLEIIFDQQLRLPVLKRNLTQKAPPTICTRREFQILLRFQK